jgi:hypothetical protein
MIQITPLHAIDKGTTKDGLQVTTLYSTHWKYNGEIMKKDQPTQLKSWYFDPAIINQEVTEEQILHEITLNDWSRWNTELPKGQKVEISETIYWDLLGCVPPRNQQGNYFEVGEVHHHEQCKPIYRACWIEENKFYTGYPKTNN